MDALAMFVASWVFFLPAGNDDSQPASRPTPDPAEAVRRLSAEFESAQRSAIELALKAKTETEKKAADRARPDRRGYAKRFISLASEATNEATTVDALAWVVRNAIRTPEGDQAIQRIADHYVRSERIAAICRPLGTRGPVGESLLRRILDENPDPIIRGRACLALALARTSQLRQEARTQVNLPQNRPDMIEARELAFQKQKSRTTALAAEIEDRLRRVLDEFPGVLIDEDITNDLGFMVENLGPAADQILRRIAEIHPQPKARFEAECGLVLHQMEIASLVADLRSVAALPPDAKHCAGPGLVAACVFGGETRLSAIDSESLAREIEQGLRRIADRVNGVNEPGLCYSHLIGDSPTLSLYYAGIEALLRRVAEGHPGPRFRAGARRSLALYLAGTVDLRRRIDSERARWVDCLGEDRVEQIRRLNPDRLQQEISALAEEFSKENQKAGRAPDAKIEGLRRGKVGRVGGAVSPIEITR